MSELIGIYMIISPSKKIYIGQSVNIKERWDSYRRMNGNLKSQRKLYNSLKKYTPKKHKFKILELCSVSMLNEKERYYQDLYSAVGENGLNLRYTTASDRSGYVSEETKEIKRQLRLGKKHKPETIEKLRNIPRTKEWRERLSIATKNVCPKIKAKQAKTLSENKENNARLLEYNKKRSLSVECYDRYTNELIGTYASIREASRQTGIDRKCISMSLSGKYKYSKGKYFKYVI